MSLDSTTAYVTNTDDGTFTAFNVPNLQPIATVAAGNNPTGVALSVDGNKLVVTNTGDNNMRVFDPWTFTDAMIPLGNSPMGVATTAFPSRGNVAYVVNYDDNFGEGVAIDDGGVFGTFMTGHGPVGIAISSGPIAGPELR